MLVEHVFVTRLEAEDTLRVAATFLAELGFDMQPRAFGEMVPCLEARRGKAKPSKARKVSELPQHVRLVFDRGRINVAASAQEQKKPGPLHREMLLALVNGLEMLLVDLQPIPEARAAWDDVDRRIEEKYERKRRNVRIALGCVVAAVVVLIAFIVAVSLKGK